MPRLDEQILTTEPATGQQEHDAAAADQALAGGIVVATNGSPEAHDALCLAARVAEREGASLQLLTVVEPVPMLPSQYAAASAAFSFEREQMDTLRERVLSDARAILGERAPAGVRLVIGAPGPTIAEAAREWNARMIVLGSSRRAPLERLFVGDTALRVVRHATVPTVAVPFGAGKLAQTAVLAVDFGAASLRAARAAVALLAKEAAVHLVHVRPLMDVPVTDPHAWSEIYDTGARKLLEDLREQLRAAAPGVSFSIQVLRGQAAQEILRYAGDVAADLIAAGQHGHGVLDRLLVGSVATTLLRGAECQLLIAPPERHAI